jgi:hypothetical protein
VETVKTITSRDGKHRIDIQRSEDGLFRYATFNDQFRTDQDFQNPPYWTIDTFSGLYETAEAAEADARADFVWLRE